MTIKLFSDKIKEIDNIRVVDNVSNNHGEVSILELDFTLRTFVCLSRSGTNTLRELKEKSDEELMSIRNFGRLSFEEVKNKLLEIENQI